MRLVIRESTFETNSSSVHSFVFKSNVAGMPAYIEWAEPISAPSADEVGKAQEVTGTAEAAETVRYDGSLQDAGSQEPKKVLRLFSWLPAAAEAERKRIESKANSGAESKYQSWYTTDPVAAAFEEWEENLTHATDPEAVAEILIFAFPSEAAVLASLRTDADQDYKNIDYCEDIDELPISHSIRALQCGQFITREKMMDAIEHQAALRGYEIEYDPSLDPRDLLYFEEDTTGPYSWPVYKGLGSISLFGSYEPWTLYERYKRWFLEGDGQGVGRLIFDDESGYVFTPEGDEAISAICTSGFDDEYEYQTMCGIRTYHGAYLLGREHSATYEHMG